MIAFSTFDQPAPSDSLFGRPTALLNSRKPAKGDQVLCTNPSNLGGGSGMLNVIQPSAAFAPGSTIALGLSALNWKVPSPATPFWAAPGSFTAHDANLSLGNLISIVKAESMAYLARTRT